MSFIICQPGSNNFYKMKFPFAGENQNCETSGKVEWHFPGDKSHVFSSMSPKLFRYISHTCTDNMKVQPKLPGGQSRPTGGKERTGEGGWGVGEHAQSTLLTKIKKASLLTLYSKINRDQGKKRKGHQKGVQKSLNTSEDHLIWRQGPLQRTRSKMRPLAWAWPCPL